MTAALVQAATFSAHLPMDGLHATPNPVTTGSRDSSAIRGQVSAVSVVAGASGAQVHIAVGPGVPFTHFTLESPNRVVIDLAAAEVALRARAYDGIARGSVVNVRISQYRSDTVRLVIDLDAAHTYTVSREDAGVVLSVNGPVLQFASWVMSARATSGQDAQALRKDEAAGRLEEMPKAAAPKSAATRPEPAPADALDLVAVRPLAPAVRRVQAPQPKPRITINLDGTDIRDVIATFATFSGRTIIAGKDVTGTVTANINDKPWDVALQAILSGQGLAATEDASGILTIDSYRNLASNQSLEPLVTRIVDVNYAKATTLQSTVQTLLARDCTGLSTMAAGREMGASTQSQSGTSMQGQGCVVRGSVSADSATNKLIITEAPSRLPEIIARLQELDIRTPQVAIKAKIIFVNRTGITDIGLAYDLGKGTEQFFQQLVPRTDPTTLTAIDTDGDGVPDSRGGGTAFEGPARIALGGKALSGIANAGNAIKPNALNLIYSAALGKYQLTAFLNALTTSSLADVQSEPSVTILNNRTATIFVGQEIPIRVIDASAGGSGGSSSGGGGQSQPNAAAFFPRATVTKEEAGIKLTVTPQITNNRMVLLDLIAENSSAELANTDIGVIFNRQKAQSQVLVADGEAAVIGGLTVTEKNKFRSGIPFLMNLPFIGRLFSQNSTTETKRDLLILVTPHIMEDGVTPPSRR
jgi:type IV pilus assembly protein PilQ